MGRCSFRQSESSHSMCNAVILMQSQRKHMLMEGVSCNKIKKTGLNYPLLMHWRVRLYAKGIDQIPCSWASAHAVLRYVFEHPQGITIQILLNFGKVKGKKIVMKGSAT